jgi:hypothetical protein
MGTAHATRAADAARATALVVLAFGLVAAMPFGRARSDEPVVVIASAEWTEASEVSLAELRRIYLGRTTSLRGRRTKPFHLRSGAPARAAFSIAVLGEREETFEDYWIEQALRGGPLPPREVPNARALVREVARSPGAIGYLPRSDLVTEGSGGIPAGIRVLHLRSTDGVLAPDDPRYPVRVAAPEADSEARSASDAPSQPTKARDTSPNR